MRWLALKYAHTVQDEDLPNIRREIKTIKELNQRGIPQVLAHGKGWFVSDYLGVSLAESWEAVKRAKLETKLQIVRETAYRLAQIHGNGTKEKGKVQGDLNPGNIFLIDVLVNIGDFEGSYSPDRYPFRRSHFLGDPRYSAPEQLYIAELDSVHPTGRADVFALGEIFWYLTTNRHPWLAKGEAITFQGFRERVVTQKPKGESPALIKNKPVLTLVRDMLAPAPEDRPTAREVVKTLDTII